jgi:hypothetical protein
MEEDLNNIDLAHLIVATSAFLLSKNADISEVPDSVIERLCDLADYELAFRLESTVH